MASGKSGLGKELAKLMDFSFVDTDQLVQMETGKSVNTIFREYGENYFRKCEHEALLTTAGQNDIVVATGGGLPCFYDNMEWMNQHGCTVYLKATPAALLSRLLASRESRPLLKDVSDDQLLVTIEQHLLEREPAYSKAKIIVPALSLKAATVKKMISEIS
jgi:shikimate kinase